MGCGACTTVCPSGAITYVYPTAADIGTRMRTLLGTFERAGGRDAGLLLHAADAEPLLAALARHGRGLPARILPIEVHHIASVGIDLWLAALAWGAAGVAVLATGREAPQYLDALRFQMSIAQTIANALGYQGEHFRLIDARAADAGTELWDWQPALPPRIAATFAVTADKRRTLAFAFDHLAQHAPVPQRTIRLVAGAAVRRDRRRPRSVHDVPRLRGIVPRGGAARQSGDAAASLHRKQLRPVWSLRQHVSRARDRAGAAARPDARGARAPRVLNEAVMFNCTRCGKPMGTEKLVLAMVERLRTHSMFAGEDSLARLRMCADCRVVDLMTNEKTVDIRGI
jgi:ferredoxin